MNLFIPVSYQTLWASIDLIPKLSVLRRIPSSKDQRKMPTRTPDVPRFASRNQVRFIVNRGKPRPSKWSQTGIHSRVLRAVARAEQIVLQEGNPQEV